MLIELQSYCNKTFWILKAKKQKSSLVQVVVALGCQFEYQKILKVNNIHEKMSNPTISEVAVANKVDKADIVTANTVEKRPAVMSTNNDVDRTPSSSVELTKAKLSNVR